MSSRAGCCIGQARVARGSWPVARVVPTAKRGPWPPPGDREEERKSERGRNIGGVDSAKEREREQGREKAPGVGGQNAFSPSYYHSYHFALPRLASSSKLPSKGSFFLLVPLRLLFFCFFLSRFSLAPPRSLLCARTHARSCARVVERVALSPGGWFRDVPLPRPSAAYRRCN